MSRNEKTQPGSRGVFLWVMGFAALAAILLTQISLVRRTGSLERLLVRDAEERESEESHITGSETTPAAGGARIRWTPRMASDAQRAGNSSLATVDALAGSVLSKMDTGFSALQGQLQTLTNALIPSATASVPQTVPEYDPTKPPNPHDVEEEERDHRSWGPEQVIGPPNAVGGDDSENAWAARAADAGPEWLWVGFRATIEVAEVRIRENHNPGGIYRVTGIINEQQVVLWEGVAAKRSGPRDFLITVKPGHVFQSVVVHLDTKRVPGAWEEIDAVELIGRDKSRQWASSATASSNYAGVEE